MLFGETRNSENHAKYIFSHLSLSFFFVIVKTTISIFASLFFTQNYITKDEDSEGFSQVCVFSASLFMLVKAKIKTLIIKIEK